LIIRFLHGKPGIYFLGKQATPELRRREFLVEAAAALDEPLLATFPADTWKRASTGTSTRRSTWSAFATTPGPTSASANGGRCAPPALYSMSWMP